MHKLFFSLLLIGIFVSRFSYAEAPALVEVESTNVISTVVDGEYKLIPYRERRKAWGFTTSVGYSSYLPENYDPNFVQANFGDIYSSADVPMIEFRVVGKRNMSFGSMGIEFNIGYSHMKSSAADLGDSDLELIPYRIGGYFALDTLMSEPFVVPYVSGGGYVMTYKENLESTTKGGNTQLAPYVAGGVAFELDWIDRSASRVSYEDSAIEGTFAYIEALSLFESSGSGDPDFSSVSWGAGLRLEF